MSLHLDMPLRFDHLAHPDQSFARGWVGEPPGLPCFIGKVPLRDPPASLAAMAVFSPSIHLLPDIITRLGGLTAARAETGRETFRLALRPPRLGRTIGRRQTGAWPPPTVSERLPE